MDKVQYFQGEQMNIIISGNDAYNLSTITFGCVIYPVEDVSKAINVPKASMEAVVGENKYIAHFASSLTRTLPVGIYNIELYDDTNDIIYQQQNAFNISTSVSGNYITSNS